MSVYTLYIYLSVCLSNLFIYLSVCLQKSLIISIKYHTWEMLCGLCQHPTVTQWRPSSAIYASMLLFFYMHVFTSFFINITVCNYSMSLCLFLSGSFNMVMRTEWLCRMWLSSSARRYSNQRWRQQTSPHTWSSRTRL